MTKKTKKGKKILTDRFVEWLVKDIRDVVGKHYRVGTTNKLRREAILLDDKQKIQHQFKETFKTSRDGANDEQDNEEEKITFSKLGKVYYETLLFCVESELWKHTRQDRLSLC